jgi:tagatose 6-phosphate kinase
MILTVTLNPLLERRFTFKKLDLSSVNRNGILKICAGGKGINVSRQLNCLSVSNIAFTFTGGNNGRYFKEALEEEKINFTSIRTAAENREASIIINEPDLKIYTFFERDPLIKLEEVEEFKTKLEKMIRNCEIVVFSGSAAPGTESIIPFGIEAANKYDKVSICDTYGSHLNDCIKKSPTILHNTIDEINDSLGVKIDSEDDKLELLKKFYTEGIKQVYLTDGSSDTYASNFDYHFKVKNAGIKEIDATGSGDSFTAGIAYGWHNNLTFEEGLINASALGTVNACKLDTSNVKFEEIDEIKSKIKVFPLGKKMKLIDVTPR